MTLLTRVASLALLFAPFATAQVTKPSDPLHAWIGLQDPAGLDTWVQSHITEERRLIASLVAVQGHHTVENTLLPYDRATLQLTLAGNQSGILFEVHPQKAIRDKAQAIVQVIAAEQTTLSLNQAVFNAISAIDTASLDAPTRHYIQHILLEYRLGGVDKDQPTRDRIRGLQDRQIELSLKFSRNVQDDVRRITVASPGGLAGLPPDFIASHKPAPDGSVTLTTDGPDYTPVTTYAASPKVRRDMLLAYTQRAFPANQAVLLDLLKTRQDIATTLGFPTWADLATADQMMGSSAKMRTFLDDVDAATRDRSDREFKLLEAFVKQKQPSALPLTLSDGPFWAEQYRRSAYAFDAQSVRPYFPYQQVEKGVLATAAHLFHVEFHEVPTAPVWDPSVHAYDVIDHGAKAGRIYLDMHPREGKDKWFSEAGIIPGVLNQQLPEATLICNFTGGVPGDPGLMEFSDVVTFFHEFGHMMHEVLGGRQRWAGQSGTTTEGDFVEAPSQMLEEIFHDPAILQSFARHYQTGEVMPLKLIADMNRASYFGRATWVQRQLFYSAISLQFHDRKPETLDFDALLKQDYERFGQLQFVPGDHFWASFTHLTGYTSNYYTYVLDKVIAVDFFAAFDPKDILDGPTALRYRRTVLEPGSSKPAADLVHDFLGRPQNIDALKKWMDREFDPPTP